MSYENRATFLIEMLRGQVSAVQLMFTGCTATCPVQGAIFADLQRQIAASSDPYQLLSLSIDPLGDSPGSLRQWLSRYNADTRRWRAAVPLMQDLDRLLDFLRGRRANGPDSHTSQAYLFDRQGRLVFRSVEMPSAGSLLDLMRTIFKNN